MLKIIEKKIYRKGSNPEQEIPTRVVFLGTNKLILLMFQHLCSDFNCSIF